MPKPAVILSPYAASWIKTGFDDLARLLALTLGPTQGNILVESDTNAQPDLVNDAATIARRLVAFPDRRRDVGAMLLRQLVWRVRQRVGDGTAVTAVLAQAMLQEATRMVAAGYSPVLLQRGIQQAVRVALEELQAQAQPARDEDDLTAVAQAVTGRPDLALVLGEMYDLLGDQAHVTIEDYLAPYLERTYLDGGRWSGKLLSPYLITANASQQAIQKDCHVALYLGPVNNADDLEPLLAQVAQSKRPRLLLVVTEMGSDALNLLVSNHVSDRSPLKAVAVKLPLGGARGQEVMDDLAVLTGATVLGPHLGSTLAKAGLDDLGQARRVEAGREWLVVVGGGGNATARREYVLQLQQRLARLHLQDANRERLQQRLARLTGRAAVLKIGAATKAERTTLHQKAEQGTRALAATVRDGYVTGGGVAYLRCVTALEALAQRLDGEERHGVLAVSRALRAPARQILHNAHAPRPDAIVHELLGRADDTIYDVVHGRFRAAAEAGVLDPARVAKVALETAASGAMLALSIDALILQRKPEMVYEP